MTNRSHLIALARFPTSCHGLQIEVGRYRKPPIPPELRYCTVCKSREVEDECHFIHDCKPLEQFRQDLFGTALQHQPGFSAMSATEKMVYLFESDNVHVIRKLA